MIRLLAVLALAFFATGPAAHAQGKVYAGPGGAEKQATDVFERLNQLLEENTEKDYEIIQKESLKTKERIMKDRAVRALAEQQQMQQQVGAVPTAPSEEAQQAQEETKKVYIYKKPTGLQKPRKVFSDY